MSDNIDWAKYYATHGNFILAQIRQDANLQSVAGEVLLMDKLWGCWYIFKVSRLIECATENITCSIYEVWAYEVGNRIRALLKQREHPAYVAEAILVYARSQYEHELNVTSFEAYDAANFIKKAIYQ